MILIKYKNITILQNGKKPNVDKKKKKKLKNGKENQVYMKKLSYVRTHITSHTLNTSEFDQVIIFGKQCE